MAHLLITRNRSYVRGGVVDSLMSFRFGKISMALAVITMTVVVSFSYLTVSNEQITQGYKINELKVAKNHLIEDKEHIARQVDQASALTNVETMALSQGMIKSSVFTYIEDGTEVAKN